MHEKNNRLAVRKIHSIENRNQESLTNKEIVNKDITVESFPEFFNKEFNLYRVPFRINYQRKMIRKYHCKALKTKKVYIK